MSEHTAGDYVRFFLFLIIAYSIMHSVFNMTGPHAFWVSLAISAGLYNSLKKKNNKS
ncbi:hypothetical protein MettiDRAFT_0764 [Methanolobus tindarius DSM 2278]|uniref:Uncharacterized protein n=1 Tax=Methanolobus tindarius DSM 2278 TaxID=1090322 RepID=W9DN25_METTI|nr:hypothetical protein MettiDRAFT_0764 [Methanolobus tindarius DSM 2278]